jgi:hypothetical protein
MDEGNPTLQRYLPAVAVLAGLALVFVIIGSFTLLFDFKVATCVGSPGAPAPQTAGDVTTCGTAGGLQPSAYAEKTIPRQLLQLFEKAGAAFGIPWYVLAAIAEEESSFGQSTLPGVHSGANSAGAEGPLQFLPGTWTRYATAAPGDSSPNIYNIGDAIFSAANYLQHLGAGNPSTLFHAVAAYEGDPDSALAQQRASSIIALADSYVTQSSSGTPLSVSPAQGALGAYGTVIGSYSATQNGIKPLFSNVPAGGFPGIRFYQGFEDQCTYYAAYQWAGLNDQGVTWSDNAEYWTRDAAAQGLTIASQPSVGSLAVWGAQSGYSQFGHVAVVVNVESNRYTVSEQNYVGPGVVDERTIPWPDPNVAGFITAQSQSD